MSIPGEQSNPYARPPQPSYQVPAQAGPGGLPSPPGVTPPRTSSGARVPGWVWGVGGAVLASAVWGAAVIVNGGFHPETEPDLAGYHFHKELCDAVDLAAFEKHYVPTVDEPRTSRHATHEALDSSTCALRFKDGRSPEGESGFEDPSPGGEHGYPPTTYVDFRASWHKKADPGPEFEGRVRTKEQYASTPKISFAVEEIKDLGQQAFLTTETSDAGPLKAATLSIRDGWVEAEIRWRRGDSTNERYLQLSPDEVERMLVQSAKATLLALKKPVDPDSSTAPGGPEDSDGPAGSDADPAETEQPPKRGEGDI